MLAAGLLLCFTGSFDRQPRSADTYGKSDAQIVEMGVGGWFKFYTDRNNRITSDDKAARIYVDAAQTETSRCLRNCSSGYKTKFRQLRREIEEYAEDVVDLSAILGNLGTLWHFQAEENSDMNVADVMFRVVSHQPYRLQRIGISDVLRSIDQTNRHIRRAVVRGEIDRHHLGNWRPAARDAKLSFKRLCRIASTFDPTVVLWVRHYCYSAAKDV
jgi:hypothetical protein